MSSILFHIRCFQVFLLICCFGIAQCLPTVVDQKEFIIYNPQITSPKKDMIWRAGASHEVTWETRDIPHELKNSKGRILLGHDGRRSENLDVEHPLAINFPLSAGHIKVTVPHAVKPRNDYFIVLFGDSGNMSQRFKIVNNVSAV